MTNNPLPTLTSPASIAIMANGITIQSLNPKGKGKARDEDNRIEIDATKVALPGKADMEGKLEDFPKDKQEEGGKDEHNNA